MLAAHCYRYNLPAVPQRIMTRPPPTVPFCIRKKVRTPSRLEVEPSVG